MNANDKPDANNDESERIWRRRNNRRALNLLCGLVISIFAFGLMPRGQARAEGREVNIYSYRQPFLLKPILEQFSRDTHVKVNVVFAKRGLVERLKREGRNSPADLLITTDVGRLGDAAEAGLLQPVNSATLRGNVPAAYRHPQGLWFGLTVRARAIFASKARVKPGELSTYEDLTSSKWKGRICSRSSLHDYNVGLMASMIAHHGVPKATAWASGVLKNLARKPQGNDRAQVRAIKEGECDLALVNTYYMGKMLADAEQKDWADAVTVFYPNQNGRGAHVNISGAALTRSAKNKDAAIELLEYLTDTKAQETYARLNHEFPVKPGVKWSPVVQSWGEFKADTLNLEKIMLHRAEAVRIFDRVGFP